MPLPMARVLVTDGFKQRDAGFGSAESQKHPILQVELP